MKYFLLAVLIFVSVAAQAEEVLPEENIMIIKPTAEYKVVKDENLPHCDNEQIINGVKAAINEYLNVQKSGSIIENRAHRLILKHIEKYTEIPLEQFDYKSSYPVANEMIMAKINLEISEENMRLCVSEGKKPIYLLIYPEDFRYRVQIIGFIPPTKDGNEFSIFYVPEVKKYDEFKM